MSLAALICFPTVLTQTTRQIAPGPSQPAAVSAAVTVPKLPSCSYTDEATPLAGYDDWALTLLDTRYAVASSYKPPDLVSTKSAGLNNGYLVRAVMVPDLKAMVRAAAAAGAPLAVISAYRSYRTQSSTFWKWVRVLGAKVAPLSSARPGHSEHQLGLAIDFKARGGAIPWAYYNWARDTKAGRWMAANAWKYGFVMSYPVGKTKLTCYGFEPWHFRYVGVEAAAQIRASGLTVREWLWRQQPRLIH
jgi:D-alanyl-D-alanine carboxypeptidase